MTGNIKFEVGDRVEAIKIYENKKPNGIGIIKATSGHTIAVEFPEWSEGHNGLGNCETPHGWNYNKDHAHEYLIKVKAVEKKITFKVGDLVTAIPGHPYSLTDASSLMEVVEVKSGVITVKIISCKKKGYISSTYDVNPKYFKKLDFTKRKIESERKKIIAEIKKDPKMRKYFNNVEKEVKEWSSLKVLGWHGINLNLGGKDGRK